MDLELLNTFLELNRTRHFGRAAEALFVTQAAVSSRLKSLENRLGAVLFDRSKREMRLTPEGSRLVSHAERMIFAWRAARQDVSPDANRQLVIGGSLRLWDVILQRWVHDLRAAYPDMAIIAEARSAEVLVRQLIDGTMDVAILLEPAQLDILDIVEIGRIEFICVSSEKGRDIEAALEEGYLYVDWGISFALDHRRMFPDAREAMTRLSHPRMALEYMHSVGGHAYLPRRMVKEDLDAGRLHEVRDAPSFSRQAYASYPVRSPRLDLINRCLEFVSAD